MYNALVWPHFKYCSTIWNDGCYSIIDKLFKLQKRAARVITGNTYDVRSTQTLDNLNWLPFEKLLKQREVIMAFKILNGRSPQYHEKLFSISQNDNYNLRSNQTKLKLPKPKKNFLKEVFRTGLRSPGTNFQVEPLKITTIFQFCRLNGNYLIHMYQPIVNSYNFCLSMYIIVVMARNVRQSLYYSFIPRCFLNRL